MAVQCFLAQSRVAAFLHVTRAQCASHGTSGIEWVLSILCGIQIRCGGVGVKGLKTRVNFLPEAPATAQVPPY